MDWRLLTCLICFYGFLKEFRPSDAFLTRYLIEHKNLTMEQINNVLYPWQTYFNLVWLVPVLLLTDLCRYKPVLILDSMGLLATWAFLLWAKGLTALKISQIIFSFSSAASVAYFAYLYTQVSREHFQKITSFIHWAALVGKFSGHLVGQLLVSFEVTDLYHLTMITFVDMCVGLVVSLFIPKVKKHQYNQLNNTDSVENSGNRSDNHSSGLLEKVKSGWRLIRDELKTIYHSRHVIIWSIWRAFAACGYFLVSKYIQSIWKVIDPQRTNKKTFNGAVEAAGTFLASLTVLLVGFLPFDWSVRGRGEGLMAMVFAVNSVCMVVIATTREIWVAYVLYGVFRATYHAALTVAAAQISKYLPPRRYGFVFGVNTLIALVIETILTVVVVDPSGMKANIRLQFEVYGGYFGLLAVVFVIVTVVAVSREGCCCCHGDARTTSIEEVTINHGDL